MKVMYLGSLRESNTHFCMKVMHIRSDLLNMHMVTFWSNFRSWENFIFVKMVNEI